MVVVGHLAYAGKAPQFLAQYANLGVRVFFVISGYLITSILLKEHSRTGTISLREFYIRRAYRIFPAAFVFVFTIILLYWRTLRWYDIGAAVLYLVNFDFGRPWIIGHLWSLSVEEQFYLLWPSVLRKWYRHRVAILWTVIMVAPFARATFIYFKVADGAYGNLLTVGDNLSTGCLLAMFADRLPKIRWQVAIIMVIAVVLIPLYGADTRLRTVFALFVLSPLVNFSVAGVLLHAVQRSYRLLNVAPLIWLGNISYSLYLWQQPFFDRSAPIRFGVLLALGLACVSYYAVEKPMLRVRERRATPTELETATVAA